MKLKHLALALAVFAVAGCTAEPAKEPGGLPKSQAPIVTESAPKISGKVIGTTEVYDRKLNKRVTVTVIEKDGKYYDASDGQQLYGFKPDGKDSRLKNKNQGVHELKMQ